MLAVVANLQSREYFCNSTNPLLHRWMIIEILIRTKIAKILHLGFRVSLIKSLTIKTRKSQNENQRNIREMHSLISSIRYQMILIGPILINIFRTFRWWITDPRPLRRLITDITINFPLIRKIILLNHHSNKLGLLKIPPPKVD